MNAPDIAAIGSGAEIPWAALVQQLIKPWSFIMVCTRLDSSLAAFFGALVVTIVTIAAARAFRLLGATCEHAHDLFEFRIYVKGVLLLKVLFSFCSAAAIQAQLAKITCNDSGLTWVIS